MEKYNYIVLNNDVIGVIDQFLGLQCLWCRKKLSIFDSLLVGVNGVYFCDTYCGQWILNIDESSQ